MHSPQATCNPKEGTVSGSSVISMMPPGHDLDRGAEAFLWVSAARGGGSKGERAGWPPRVACPPAVPQPFVGVLRRRGHVLAPGTGEELG